MYFGASQYCLLALLATAAGERWRWPSGRLEASPSVRIDTKVRFVDYEDAGDSKNNRNNNVQSDEIPYKQPTDTEGFYSRPPGAGRYPVRVDSHIAPYRVNGQGVYPVTTYRPPSDGTLDSLQYCKCVSTQDCNPHSDTNRACGSGQYLCCYKRPNKSPVQNSEYFNEIDDERTMLLPGRPNAGGAFLPPPDSEYEGIYGNNQQNAFIGNNNGRPGTRPEILVGPMGATGQIGPPNKPVLVGPNGPSGNIGPPGQNPAVLVGPDGPSGIIGPAGSFNQNLNRPDPPRDVGPSESAQRGVLVGPGGPTGIIGPYNQRPVLVGPGGPSGIIGPNRGYRGSFGFGRPGYRQSNPGLLVGPGGPTGTIGPGRQLLVGPGGPTGQIGPRRYFGN